MTYAEQLRTGSMNEIVTCVLDRLETELPYRHKGIPQQIVRDALIEFFNRGAHLARQEVHATVQHNDGSDSSPSPATQH